MKPNPSAALSCYWFKPRRAWAWLALGCLGALAGPVVAADANFIAVVKGQRFVQAGPDLVALTEPNNPDDDREMALEVFADGAAADSLVSGTVELPGGTTLPLAREDPSDSGLAYVYETDQLLDLDTARPNGTYTVNLTTKNDGVNRVDLNLMGDLYPPVPKVTNFTALQTINHAADTTVEWSPMGGEPMDFIQLSVYDTNGNWDEVYSSPGPGEPGALNGASVSSIIPGSRLQPGRTYEAEVLFVKVVDLKTSYSTAIAGYYKVVGFKINTAPLEGVALGAELEAVVPQPQTWDVPRASAVTFRFSRPMNPESYSVNWSINGVSSSNFTYDWLDGNRVLHCKYNTALPANTDINWSLDLTGFRDAAGFPLAGNPSGSFHTNSDTPASQPDVEGFFVFKMQGFEQTGAAPVSTGMFGCDVAVEPTAYNRVKEPATFTLGGNGFSGRLRPSDWDAEMYSENTFASKDDLDRFFTNGSVTFNLSTLADGNKTLELDLGSADAYPDAYPDAPTVTNLPTLQSINPAADTPITWNALTGWNPDIGVGSGVVELEIDNEQGDEVVWVDHKAISGGTQWTIPAGTLWPGRTYRVSLTFLKITDLDDSYGAFGGGAGFGSITEFTIKTSGTPAMPNVAIERMWNGMNLNLSGGEPNRNYVVETSSDLQRWLPQQDLWIDQGGASQYYDDDARYLGTRYYRLRDRLPDEQVQPNISIQGTVWTDGSHTTPVAGAVVGTTLDDHTVVTDAAGRFFLESDTKSSNGGAEYTITVTKGAQSKGFGPGMWGDRPREQHFEMQ
ncbi:MAG: Ig-like domain-containing protein [Akkermansiaceae bacterium]|nr:Ig-like domain-containing protein [Akkermansiaceae bacterium]MCF7734456.1 Ig-like domain-containing protein [Akkermansiaceae bacterium]